MKSRSFFLFFSLLALLCQGQQGITTVDMPQGFTLMQHRNKNCIKTSPGSGVIYLGFRDIGLGVWENNTWTVFDSLDWQLSSNNVRSIETKNDTVWIGTQRGLIFKIGGTFGNYTTANSGILSDTINCIYATTNKLWIGTPRGISVLQNGNFTNYTQANTSLPSNVINDISGTPDNYYMWFGTNNGFSEFSNNYWTHFNNSNSILPVGGINKVFYSGSNLFLSSGSSLFSYTNQVFESIGTNFSSTINGIEGLGNEIYISQGSTILNGVNSNIQTYFLPHVSSSIIIEFDPINQTIMYVNRVGLSDSLSKMRIVSIAFFQNNYLPYSSSSPYSEADPGNNELNQNNLNVMVRNTGEMFWNRLTGYPACEFPNGSGKHIGFSNAIWLGGIDAGGQLHLAAQTYRQTGNDIWPGPLNPSNGNTDSATFEGFKKSWKIKKEWVEDFKFQYALGNVTNGTYQPAEVILDWPVSNPFNSTHGLARYKDVNQDGVYDPMGAGDYPEFEGDMAVFWIMNDNFSAHTESGGLPLKVEIHGEAFSYHCNNLPDTLKIINNTAFFRYKLINRSNLTYSNSVLGIWNDPDLGDFSDDYIATDSLNNAIFAYNSDANDGSGIGNSYGSVIPISSVQILKGPEAMPNDQKDNNNNGVIDETNEECLLAGSMIYRNQSGVQGNPSSTSDFFNYLNQLWKDSTNLTLGQMGYNPNGQVTRFAFGGEPWDTTQWIMSSAGDWRMIANIGPFNFSPNDTVIVEWALIASLDSSLTWGTQSYFENASDDRSQIFNWYRNSRTTPCDTGNLRIGLTNIPPFLCSGSTLDLTWISNQSIPPNTPLVIQTEGNYFSFNQPVILDTIFLNGTQANFQIPFPSSALGDTIMRILAFIPGTEIQTQIISIPVVNLPQPQFQISNNQLNSLPLLAEFTNFTNPTSGYDFIWSFGDGYSMLNNAPQIQYSYLSNGLYHVSLMVLDPISGCNISNFNPNNPAQQIICNATDALDCGMTPTTSPSGLFNTCNGGQVTITAQSFPLNSILQWYKNGIPIGGEIASTLTTNSPGWYYFSAIQPDGCSSVSSPLQITHTTNAGNPPSISVSGSYGQCNNIAVTLTASGNFSNYLWSNGSSGNIINVTTPGSYFVIGQSQNCDLISEPVYINGSGTEAPIICLATVQPISNSSLLIWEKPVSNEIDSFLVFREIPQNPGNFLKIGAKDYSDLSEFEDLNPEPGRSNKYAIAILDTCTGVSSLGAPTSTIFLQASPGIGTSRTLNWSPYHEPGNSMGKYLIYSGSNPSNLSLIDSVSSQQNFYQDVMPVSGLNTVYMIEKQLNVNCQSTRTQANTSQSNITGNSTLSPSGIDNSNLSNLTAMVRPNPNKGKFEILLSEKQKGVWCLYDLHGRLVKSPERFENGNINATLDLESGCYVAKIQSSSRVTYARLIIQ
jgi:hypothetical protein